ncbi:hypothetical protein [Flavobacterium sp. TBRC 19031]|uniref:hypothetical protein n=1 Tax=Flavobacterium mekongense TaxID=3379707 RepID=UPI00399AFD45
MRYLKFRDYNLVMGFFVHLSVCAQAPVLPPNPVTSILPQYTTSELVNRSDKKNSVSPPASYLTLPNTQQRQNAAIIAETERHINLSSVNLDIKADIEKMQAQRTVNYSLPSFQNRAGTNFYREAFEKIILTDTVYNLKETNFTIENAYFENVLDKAEFDNAIKSAGDFIKSKMKEEKYSLDSNTAKNFMLFSFFTESLVLKSDKQKHLPFKYDFEDYMGLKDYSKMFVSKLLATGSGQCHSMPLLYLLLADEIGAEAYLALSPNHSYIRFPDDHGKWFNIELTNGMFSTDSYILQSGYIKSEALQSGIYMQNLSKKELLANLLTDLASGYVRKYGYDEFVSEIIEKALSFYPNSVNAHILNGQLKAARFEYVMRQLKINPNDQKDLQRINQYPQAIKMLNEVNAVFAHVDNLGYEPMPDEAYQAWLQSMNKENEKQKNEELTKQLRKALPDKKNTTKG